MRHTTAYALSAAAGLALLIAQTEEVYRVYIIIVEQFLEYIERTINSFRQPEHGRELELNISSYQYLLKISFYIAVVAATTSVVAIIENVVYDRIAIKYAQFSQSIAQLAINFMKNRAAAQDGTSQDSEKEIRQIMEELLRMLKFNMSGDVYSFSLMIPTYDNTNKPLHLRYYMSGSISTQGIISDAIDSHANGDKFEWGEGFCCAAWDALEPQSGNNKRLLGFYIDKRFSSKAVSTARKYSFFSTHIRSLPSYIGPAVAILNIDSDDVTDFPRSKKHARYVRDILTPIVEMLHYNLVQLEETTGILKLKNKEAAKDDKPATEEDSGERKTEP